MDKNNKTTQIDGFTLDAIIENNLNIVEGVGKYQGLEGLIRAEKEFLKQRLPTLNAALEESGANEYFDLNRFEFIANHLFGPDENSSMPAFKKGLYTKAIERRVEPVNPRYENASSYLEGDDIDGAFDQLPFDVSDLITFAQDPERDVHQPSDDRKQFIKGISHCYSEMLKASPLKNKNQLVALIMTEQLAQELDHTLDLGSIEPSTIYQISKEAIAGNLTQLESLFDEHCRSLYNTEDLELEVGNKSLMETIDLLNGTSDAIFKTEDGNDVDYLSRHNIQLEDSSLENDKRTKSSLEP